MWLDADDVITSENQEKLLEVERKHGFRYGCGYDGLCSGI
ncbi:MAG: hypothetical protein ACLTZM_07365 [Ruminococcus sp.]